MRRHDDPVSAVNPKKIEWHRRQEERRRKEAELAEQLRVQEEACYRDWTPKQNFDRTIRRSKRRARRATVVA